MKIHQVLPGRLLENFAAQQPARTRRACDIAGITETIQRALASAGLNTQSGPMKGVTDTIHHALSAAGRQRSAPPSDHATATIEGSCREIDAAGNDIDSTPVKPSRPTEDTVHGEFLLRSFTNEAGTRTYKLYIPASYSIGSSDAVSIVVMLSRLHRSLRTTSLPAPA